MRFVTFDPFRTLGLPGVRYIKPEHMHRHIDELKAADWLLFPEYWQLNTLHYVLRRPIFPSPVSYHLGHDKVEMTRAFQAACPDHVPRTEIAANTPQVAEELLSRWRFPFVAKVPRASMGLGVFPIEHAADWQRYLALTPVLYVQEMLPLERDLRIVLVGTRIVAAYWREESGFHNNLARGARVRTDLPVPDEAIAFVHSLAGFLGIDHAGFDVAWVDGRPLLLEFNRLFGHQGMPGLQREVAAAMRDYLLPADGSTTPDSRSA